MKFFKSAKKEKEAEEPNFLAEETKNKMLKDKSTKGTPENQKYIWQTFQ